MTGCRDFNRLGSVMVGSEACFTGRIFDEGGNLGYCRYRMCDVGYEEESSLAMISLRVFYFVVWSRVKFSIL